jgi:hypothetical protein
MHGRNHRPKGWYGPADPGGSDPLNWLTYDPDRRIDEVILSHSPEGFWKLNELSGTTANDSSGNGNHLDSGSYNPPDWQQPSGPPGDITADFNATNQARVFRSWPVISGDFTVEVWVRRHDTNHCSLLGQSRSSAVGGFNLYISAFNVGGQENRPFFGTAVGPDEIPAGEWTHLAGVRHGDDWRIYVGGAKVAETTEPAWTPAQHPTDFWIGHDGGTFGVPASYVPMRGRGSYAALYNRALTDTEILAHVTAAPPEGRIVSVPYTIEMTDRFIFATGTGTVTLPSADARNGLWFTVKNIDTGTVTVSAPGTEKMEGAGSPGSASLSAGVARQFTSDGIGWRITGGYL